MGGTIAGGKKASVTNKEKYGEDFYRRIAAIGGRAKVPKGFALMTPEQRSEAGTKGGTVSKRRKAKK